MAHVTDIANPHVVTASQAGAAPVANGVTNGDTHNHAGGDGAQVDHTGLLNIGVNTHTQVDAHLADTLLHAGKNAIINGNFGINQRAATGTVLMFMPMPFIVI